MSITRNCIRIATVMALRDKTWAGSRVYDSNNVPIDKIDQHEDNAPYISVFTDTDTVTDVEGYELLAGSRELDLVVEMRIAGSIEEVEGGPTVRIYPTDEAAETALDILQYQIFKALVHDTSSQWGNIWKGLVHRILRVRAHRGGEAERGIRWSARAVILTVDTHTEIAPGLAVDDDDPTRICLAAMTLSDEPGLVAKAKLISDELAIPVTSSWRQAQAILGLTEFGVRGIGLGPPLDGDEPITITTEMGFDPTKEDETFDNADVSKIVGDNEPKEPPPSGIPWPDPLTYPNKV